MKLYSYVIKFDTGFAPNPFWGYCTLATCKPAIRRTAEHGDWVIGCGSNLNVGYGRLIYAMKITESPLGFEQYYRDKRFQNKKPKEHRDLRYKRGDNIYSKDKMGKWNQRLSMHCLSHMKNDLGGKRVLISDYFWYFGREAPKIPKRFQKLVFTGMNHRSNFSENLIQKFIAWIEKNHHQGIQGNPCQEWYNHCDLVAVRGKC